MDAYERRCRRLLRAYPIRWRERRGDELVGTLLDLAEPDQRRRRRRRRRYPSLRDSFDLVRAGLLTRWREHPPFGRWLLYRLAGRPLPPKWRRWARDDVLGHGLLVSRLIISLVVGLAAWLVLGHLTSSLWTMATWLLFGLPMLIASWLAVYYAHRHQRRHFLRQHGPHAKWSDLV